VIGMVRDRKMSRTQSQSQKLISKSKKLHNSDYTKWGSPKHREQGARTLEKAEIILSGLLSQWKWYFKRILINRHLRA
jgi:hypothetical protein